MKRCSVKRYGVKRASTFLAAVAAGSLVAAQAQAGGLVVARFGGEHGHPTASNPTAIYYNPAGLSLGSGTRLMIDATLAWRAYTYERPAGAVGQILEGAYDPGSPQGGTPSGDGVTANTGKAELFNVLASPFIGVASDLGIEGLGVGAGFYVPIGGQSKWEQTDAVDGFPGAEDGAQRWWVEEGQIRSLYITAAGSYYIKPARLALGIGVNMVKSEIFTVRARNGDGSDDLVNRFSDADGNFADRLKEGRGLVDLSSWDLALSAGLVYQPMDGMFVGLSYQSQPGFGENTLEGRSLKILAQSDNVEADAEAIQTMPDIVRWGWRWREGMNEYRLFGDYTRWSVFESQCIQSVGSSTPCDLANIPRNWEDTFGVRAGYSRWITPSVELYVGAGYDASAVPDETLEPVLYDAEKVTAGLGGRFSLFDDSLGIAATYTQVIYFDRETDAWPRDPNTGRLIPQGAFASAANPNSAGKYSQAIGVFNLNVEYAF